MDERIASWIGGNRGLWPILLSVALMSACSDSRGGSNAGSPDAGGSGPGNNVSGAAESLANALSFQNAAAATIDGPMPAESEGAPELEPSSGEGTLSPGATGSVKVKVAGDDSADPVVATLVWFEGASSFISLPVAGATKEDDGTIVNDFTVSQAVCDDLCNIVHQVKCYEAAQTTAGLVTKANLQSVLLDCTGSGDPDVCDPGGGGGGTPDGGTTDPGTMLEKSKVTFGGVADEAWLGYAKPIECSDGKWYWVSSYLSDGYDQIQIYGPPESGTSRAVGTPEDMTDANDCHGESHTMMRVHCEGPDTPSCQKGGWVSVSGTVSATTVEGKAATSIGTEDGPFVEYTFDVSMKLGDKTELLEGSFRVQKSSVDSARP